MDWLNSIFIEHSGIQAVVVLFTIIAAGLVLGRIKIAGISLGVTFVFFCGILAGHLHIAIDPQMLLFAMNFGLIVFVYSLGIQVGPGFFNSFRQGGIQLNLLGIGVVATGTLMAVMLTFCTPIKLPDMMGVLSGAVTNTPALAAAQQTLRQLGMDTASPALGCAVAYPLGVVGVIFAIILIRKTLVRPDRIQSGPDDTSGSTFIATFRIENPAIFEKTIEDIAHLTPDHFVISRIWHNGNVAIPNSSCVLHKDDRILIVTKQEYESDLTLIFGEKEATDWNKKGINWNALDDRLVSHNLVVTRPSINGHTIGSLKLRNRFGVNISRVLRSGVMLLATPDLVLRLGDRLIVVGQEDGIAAVEKLLGNTVKELREPNLVSLCIGIILGLALGAVPIAIPGITAPVRLGLAGGPIIIGILMGAFGPRVHMVTYTTESANLMLRRLGLALYLACLGLDSGEHFFDTVFRPEGALWIGTGFALTIVPVLIMGFISMKFTKLDFGTVTGMLCGSMANPMALTYVADTIPNNHAALAYTQVYPLCMFLRVIIAQLVLLFFL